MKIYVATIHYFDTDATEVSVFQNRFALSGWYLERALEGVKDHMESFEFEEEQNYALQKLVADIELGEYKQFGWDAWNRLKDITNDDYPMNVKLDDSIQTLIEEYNGHGIG